ncbi:type II CRISPR RNA-guided endonuclease Cas9 [Ferruginivarius sediminum]|uniref:CRISPR-associated endonuclease Cas9 n=1 Tax=Ferruginivarius sediminum TaxID=2661937 RepID=A0A369TE57_9PROT|nr:type II CRISPR RNA-guided endonuclease Cas9 [Ferruginivarius sediminum]RDD61216.1 CRISPR-associated protein Csn1 [Ferruginivarius sediminum]
MPADTSSNLPWMLGVDIGTDSIGWAAFRCCAGPDRPAAEKLLAGGVRLFDSGRDPETQTSKQRERGEKRRARRPKRARRWRKAQLEACLKQAGIDGHPGDGADPYALRAKAAKGAVEPAELRAVLLHMNKHRGFRSNLLDRRQADTRADSKKGKKANKDGGQEDSGQNEETNFWLGAEAHLRERMAATGAPTVGALFAADLAQGRPVRMRYGGGDAYAPTRALIEEELGKIREMQEAAFPGLDWDAVAELVLDQRPLRSPEAGRCGYLPEEDRAWRALPSVQEFILRQTLGNLRLPQGFDEADRPLTAVEYEAALTELRQVPRLEWPKLRKAIGIGRNKFTVELQAGAGKQASRAAEGHQTDALFAPLIPGWNERSLTEKDALFTELWERRGRRAGLLAYIRDSRQGLGLDGERAGMLADAVQFELPTGRAQISAAAAHRILPYMTPGVRVHDAVVEALGRDPTDARPAHRYARLPYYAQAMPDVGMNGTGAPEDLDDPERFHGRIANISVHIALNELRKLVNKLLDRYGSDLRLVVVETTRELKAGAEERQTRQRDQAAKEADNAAIDAELRRQGQWLSNARERRRRHRLAKRQNHLCPYTGNRIAAADLLSEAYEVDHVIPVSLGGRDVESNMVICEAAANRRKGDRTPWEAFHDDPAWQARVDNFLEGLDPSERKAIAWRFGEKAAALAKRGGDDEDDESSWAPRQITDTSYIARTSVRYLRHVVAERPGNDVIASNGRLTGWLRAAWDLTPPMRGRDLIPLSHAALGDPQLLDQELAALEPAHLRKAVDSLIKAWTPKVSKRLPDANRADVAAYLVRGAGGRKNRLDHRHHFIDAAVIATTDRPMVQWINTLHSRHGADGLPNPAEAEVAEPYEGFRADVMRTYERIWPSFRPRHRTEGQLHEETLYGVRDATNGDAPGKNLVLRRPVERLFQDANGKPLPDDKVEKTMSAFASPRMRERFEAVVGEYRAAEPEASLSDLCLKAARDPRWGPRGMTGNTVVTGTYDGDETRSVIWNFRGNTGAAVITGGNTFYHVWELTGRNGKVKWQAEVVPRFHARNGNRPEPPQPGARLVMTLSQGDLLYWPGQTAERIFQVKKMVTDGRLYVWPARHATGREAAAYVQALFPAINLNGDQGYKFSSAEGLRKADIRPATISILGRLRVK